MSDAVLLSRFVTEDTALTDKQITGILNGSNSDGLMMILVMCAAESVRRRVKL